MSHLLNKAAKKNTRNKETLLFALWLLKTAALGLEIALPTPQILPSYKQSLEPG